MPVTFQLNWDKAIAAILYLAGKNLPEFDRYKACKLLFLADKFHVVRFARPVTGDVYYALPYGPVPSRILDRLEAFEAGRDEQLASVLELDVKFTYPRYAAKASPDYSVLSQSEVMALDRAIELFGNKTFPELKSITHEMPAYSKPWKAKPSDSNRAEMNFEDFFDEDAEAVAGALEEMQENDTMRKAFPEF